MFGRRFALTITCALLFAGCSGQTNSSLPTSPSPSGTTLATASPIVTKSSSPSPSIAGQKKVAPSPTLRITSKPTATSTSNSQTQTSTVTTTSNPTATTATTPQPTRVSTPAPTQQSSGTITVSTTSITQTVNRSQEVSGVIPLNGFTISSQGADSFSVGKVTNTNAFSSSTCCGGIIPGTSVFIPLNLNSQIITNGTYTATYLVGYSKNGVDYSGPTVTYTVTLEGNVSSNKLTVSTTNLTETLSKANAQPNAAIFATPFTITSNGSDGYQLFVNRTTPVPFETNLNFGPSGEPLTTGQTVTIQPVLNKYLPNGVYTGYVLVRYTQNHLYVDSPITVNYTFTLTD